MSVTAAAAIGAGVGLASLGAGIYQSWKNYNSQSSNLDYQKALQQKIFEREDTAVQRRKQDLLKAGFNPFLATGQSAQAGQAVSTTAPQFDKIDISKNLGQAVDFVRSLEDMKQAKLYTKYMELKNVQQGYDNERTFLDMLDYGNKVDTDWLYDDNGTFRRFDYRNGYTPDEFSRVRNSSLRFKLRQQILDQLPYELNLLKNSSAISDVQKKFAMSDKIEGYIMDALDAFIGGSNSARGWFGEYGKNKRYQPQRSSESGTKFRDRNGVWHYNKNYSY